MCWSFPQITTVLFENVPETTGRRAIVFKIDRQHRESERLCGDNIQEIDSVSNHIPIFSARNAISGSPFDFQNQAPALEPLRQGGDIQLETNEGGT